MRFLFLKRSQNWPRAAGHDVHTFEMARALAALGHAIGFATVVPPGPRALMGLALELGVHSLAGDHSPNDVELGYLQRRFMRYWGIEPAWQMAAARLCEVLQPDVVVAACLEFLPVLAAARGAVRVWYPADEYALHHLTQIQWSRPATWRNVTAAAVAALYERSYSRRYDRAWVVSRAEARAMRWIGGARAVDVAPNGVDAAYFCPAEEQAIPNSCAFWGRLDAGPNIQAVEWFCRWVWPSLRRECPEARLGLYGFAPTASVRALSGNGVEVIANAPDLRPAVRRHQVAIMPFRSGGGIKNKLLEAAALGLPIVATPRGCVGLDDRDGLPVVVARRPTQWVRAIRELWIDAARRRELGAASRAWVVRRHTWEAAARAVLDRLPPRTAVLGVPTS